jgi:hypothetical protein
MKPVLILFGFIIAPFLLFSFSFKTIDFEDSKRGCCSKTIEEFEIKRPGTAEFRMDSVHQIFEFRFIEPEGENDNRFNLASASPAPQKTPFLRFNRNKNENIIDLSDSGIISYKKKKLSGGREKIVIIRKMEKPAKQ